MDRKYQVQEFIHQFPDRTFDMLLLPKDVINSFKSRPEIPMIDEAMIAKASQFYTKCITKTWEEIPHKVVVEKMGANFPDNGNKLSKLAKVLTASVLFGGKPFFDFYINE